MITTEYSVAGPADSHTAHQYLSIAIVADLHEFEPKPVVVVHGRYENNAQLIS